MLKVVILITDRPSFFLLVLEKVMADHGIITRQGFP